MMAKKNKRGNPIGFGHPDWVPNDVGRENWHDHMQPNQQQIRRPNFGAGGNVSSQNQGRWSREAEWFNRGYDDFFGPNAYNKLWNSQNQNDPNYWLKEQIRRREGQLAEIMERQNQLMAHTRGAMGFNQPPPLMSLDLRHQRYGRKNLDWYGFKQNRSGPGQNQQSRRIHCDVCNSNIEGSFKTHCRSTPHKREVQVKRGCGWCGIDTFKSFNEMREHRMTTGHLEKQEKHGKKRGERENEITDPDDLPDYEPGCIRGQKYVIPVTGFYCNLCKKFFREEISATVDHCSSEAHYEKWKEAKLMSLRDRKNAKNKDAKSEDEEEGKENGDESLSEQGASQEEAVQEVVQEAAVVEDDDFSSEESQ